MFVVGIVILAACERMRARHYVALKAVTIFREPIDGTDDVIYRVAEGESCSLGAAVTKKVFMFREVTCGDIHGWTMDWTEFEPIDTHSAGEGDAQRRKVKR